MKEIINKYYKYIIGIIALLNLAIRLIIYYSTELFYFGDYQGYLRGIERISNGETLTLVAINSVTVISYLGYFAKHILGSLDYFFLFNILLATVSSVLISLFAGRISNSKSASVLTMLFLSIYTEYLVFSAIFYTPVAMIFLLIVLMILLRKYYCSDNYRKWLFLLIIGIIVFVSFLFKPTLVFLPVFLYLISIILRKDFAFAGRTALLASLLLILTAAFYISPLITGSKTYNKVSNSFIFFGHTDYGGDGGEGAFVYPENEERFKTAFNQYLADNNITNPEAHHRNQFKNQEIIKFVTQHPFQWIKLQFHKFFRTFGVVPEGNSYKVLYTGLLKGKLWLTSIIVTAPFALIILLLIQSFNNSTFKHLISGKLLFKQSRDNLTYNSQSKTGHRHFLYIYILLFFYYVLAICFFGHFQERYRMPVMVCFIIPLTSIFISHFKWKDYFSKPGIYIRSLITVLFLVIWIIQIKTAMANTDRFHKAVESAQESINTRE